MEELYCSGVLIEEAHSSEGVPMEEVHCREVS